VLELRGAKLVLRGLRQFGLNNHYNEMMLASSVNEPGASVLAVSANPCPVEKSFHQLRGV
jgi:hypothetical protein